MQRWNEFKELLRSLSRTAFPRFWEMNLSKTPANESDIAGTFLILFSFVGAFEFLSFASPKYHWHAVEGICVLLAVSGINCGILVKQLSILVCIYSAFMLCSYPSKIAANIVPLMGAGKEMNAFLFHLFFYYVAWLFAYLFRCSLLRVWLNSWDGRYDDERHHS